MSRRLYRSRGERMVSGVAGGVSEYLDVDPSIVRVLWAVLAVVSGGVLLLLYLLMWIVVPEAPPSAETPAGSDAASGGTAPSSAAAAPRDRTAGGVVFGLILVATGGYFLAREFVPELELNRVWPLALVVLGLVLLALAFRRRDA